jgi:NADH:ubiquinone oxidoreductase subunit E
VLTGEARREAEAIARRYPNARSATLPLLFLVQGIEGYVTEHGMREVGELLGLTPAQVLAAGSFYTMLKRRPQGDYLISVCRNISCTHLGARDVIAAFQQRLGIEPGETTADGRFTLETAECLATCDGAPSLQVNYEDFCRVTPERAASLVDELEAGDDLHSERGERVKTHKEISHEIATTGLRVPGSAGEQTARTIGGESPRADTAPGWRPKVRGEEVARNSG